MTIPGTVFLLDEKEKQILTLLQLQTLLCCFFLKWCLFFFFICFSWKEMWLQDYWQSLDQGEALTAMIRHNESHQGRFWDYMHEIFLKRTRQHWSIPVRAWFENCLESCDWEFLLLSKCLPWNRRNSRRLFFWCMKWVVLCCDFSCGGVSNCLYLNFSSVLWSCSWRAGVNMWGKRGILHLVSLPCGFLDFRGTYFRLCSNALSYFKNFFISKTLVFFIFHHLLSSLSYTFTW